MTDYCKTLEDKYKVSIHRYEIDAGWFNLVDELIEKLVKFKWDKQIFCIKEKFGGLRVQPDNGLNDDATEEERKNFYDVIHQAEQQSFEICEVCGASGKLCRLGGWMMTRCEMCFEETKKK